MQSRTLGRAGALALAGVIAASVMGCGPSKPELTPSQDDVEPAVVVQSEDNFYSPQNVTIKKGEAVKWEFSGGAKHDVVAADGSFVSELVDSGSFTHVFDEVGEFAYDCSIHPEMVGTVTVVE